MTGHERGPLADPMVGDDNDIAGDLTAAMQRAAAVLAQSRGQRAAASSRFEEGAAAALTMGLHGISEMPLRYLNATTRSAAQGHAQARLMAPPAMCGSGGTPQPHAQTPDVATHSSSSSVSAADAPLAETLSTAVQDLEGELVAANMIKDKSAEALAEEARAAAKGAFNLMGPHQNYEKLDRLIVDVHLVRGSSNAGVATPNARPSGPTPSTRIADLLVSLLGEGKAAEGKVNRHSIMKMLPRMATTLRTPLPSVCEAPFGFFADVKWNPPGSLYLAMCGNEDACATMRTRYAEWLAEQQAKKARLGKAKARLQRLYDKNTLAKLGDNITFDMLADDEENVEQDLFMERLQELLGEAGLVLQRREPDPVALSGYPDVEHIIECDEPPPVVLGESERRELVERYKAIMRAHRDRTPGDRLWYYNGLTSNPVRRAGNWANGRTSATDLHVLTEVRQSAPAALHATLCPAPRSDTTRASDHLDLCVCISCAASWRVRLRLGGPPRGSRHGRSGRGLPGQASQVLEQAL